MFGPPGSQDNQDDDSFSYHEDGEDEQMEDLEEQAFNQSVNEDNRIAFNFNQIVEFKAEDEKSFANPADEMTVEQQEP